MTRGIVDGMHTTSDVEVRLAHAAAQLRVVEAADSVTPPLRRPFANVFRDIYETAYEAHWGRRPDPGVASTGPNLEGDIQ